MFKNYTPVNTNVFTKSLYHFLLTTAFFSLLSFSNLQAQNGSSFRTVTQEKWGAVPKGNNSAAYMYRKFEAAFPNGITVGCTNKLVFSNPNAVTDFLPSSGALSVLPSGTNTNPKATFSNVLAGHILALKLNIGFDEYDSKFSTSNMLLKNMVIKTGIFAGKSVQEIIELAENTIGGCPTAFELSNLSDVVAKINQNYDNSTADMGFLAFTTTTQNACVNDREPPVFKETPQTFTVFTEECYIASWNMPVVTDNCSTVTLTCNVNLGECLPLGVHKVIMTAADATGNKSTYSFTITIEQGVYIVPLNRKSSNSEFVAHSTKKDICLDWVNKDNEKTKLFIIEKANALGDFEEIKTLVARSFAGYQDYSFTDTKPEKEENSYRIKTVFKDGTVQSSRAKTVNYKDKDLVQVYPSPGADIVNLDLTPYSNQNVQLYLYDYIGKPVYNQFVQQATDRPIKIDVLDLPDGQYVLSIIPQGDKEVTKAVFIRN
jgi:Secretion system C-terminal sorting domain/HYR domain